MYSWEIAELLKERDYLVEAKEVLKLIDPHLNPQLSLILYNDKEKEYKMRDVDGNFFCFKVKKMEMSPFNKKFR